MLMAHRSDSMPTPGRGCAFYGRLNAVKFYCLQRDTVKPETVAGTRARLGAAREISRLGSLRSIPVMVMDCIGNFACQTHCDLVHDTVQAPCQAPANRLEQPRQAHRVAERQRLLNVEL